MIFWLHTMCVERRIHRMQYDGEGRTVLALALESGHTIQRWDKNNRRSIQELVDTTGACLDFCDLPSRVSAGNCYSSSS